MFNGSHTVVFTKDANADRAFFRDVLEMPAVDAGGGWLVFALPPAEVAFHRANDNDRHALYLMCDDLALTIENLSKRGARFETPTEESWGTTTEMHLPGGGRIGIYQPKHATAV